MRNPDFSYPRDAGMPGLWVRTAVLDFAGSDAKIPG